MDKAYRREHNLGIFSHLAIAMQLRMVKRVAKKYHIDLAGVKIAIQRDPAWLDSPFTGAAVPGRVDLFPNAFASEEMLARTLFHELVHIKQYEIYGHAYVQKHVLYFEDLAYEAESIKFDKGK